MKTQMKRLFSVSLMAVATALSGCAVAPNSGNVYRSHESQNEQTVRIATVESVREVTIDKGSTGTGTMAGAALGGLAGSNMGGGNGSVAGAIVGALVGGIVGQRIEADGAQRRGLEITVRLDNGELRAITQDADEMFRSGDQVRLLTTGKRTRVTH